MTVDEPEDKTPMVDEQRQRELVLVGGGHSHVQVLRRFAMRPPSGARLTLVLDVPVAIYSGMVPGFVAGQYRSEELEIDVVPLARRANARVILSPAVGVDTAARRILLRDRPPVSYDLASFDIGSTVIGLDTPGVREHALPTRPINRLVARLAAFFERRRGLGSEPLRVVVVGAGAGGVELAFTLEQRLNRQLGVLTTVKLVTSDPEVLRGYPQGLIGRIHRHAKSREIEIETNRRVVAAEADRIHFGDGTMTPCDALVWVAGAWAHDLFRSSGLATDERGFVLTRSTLQIEGHDELFAVGDCATLEEHPETPKAGVYAVRQGPYLIDNLYAALEGRPLRRYRPQSDFLTLLNLGDGQALGCKKGLSFEGRWVMQLKDWIDRRFMKRFQVLAIDGALSEIFRALPAMDGGEMLCGGCAAKVGQTPLRRALERLGPGVEDPAVVVGLAQADDAAAIRTPKGDVVVSSLDAFRAFTDDPYLVGRVAAVNAMSDLFAKGVAPRFCSSLIAVPENESSEVAEETLYQVLAGMRAALEPLGVTLLGGHTTTAPGLLVGLTVEGIIDDEADLLRLSGLRPGHQLILTKALGTGVLFHADMQARAAGPWMVAALESMLRPNDVASSVACQHAAGASTDVTGFGLIGHLAEMLRRSEVSAVLDVASLPALPGSVEVLRQGLRSTFHPENERAKKGLVIRPAAALHPCFELLFDPQTSGGLLFGVEAARAEGAVAELHRGGDMAARIIGRVVPSREEDGALIEVVSTEFAGSELS